MRSWNDFPEDEATLNDSNETAWIFLSSKSNLCKNTSYFSSVAGITHHHGVVPTQPSLRCDCDRFRVRDLYRFEWVNEWIMRSADRWWWWRRWASIFFQQAAGEKLNHKWYCFIGCWIFLQLADWHHDQDQLSTWSLHWSLHFETLAQAIRSLSS